MANEETDTENQLVIEIQELRNEFREYRNISNQSKTNRRVENIQVLVALGIVGAAVTLYSSGAVENSFWRGLLNSPYWNPVLVAFFMSNTMFLTLKLITIPLMSVFDHRYISILHEELEPFLYFFTIIGAVVAILLRGISAPIYVSLGTTMKTTMAIVALLFPLVIGIGYAQFYRISAVLQQYTYSFLIIDAILDDLEQAGRISAETSALVMNQAVQTVTPTPILLRGSKITSRVIIQILQVQIPILRNAASSILDVYMGAVRELNGFLYTLLNSLWIGFPLSEDMFNRPDKSTNITDEEEKELKLMLQSIRNKQAHGRLDKKDVEKLQDLIEKLSEIEDNSDDEN